jgi:hypothetical protein
VPGHIWQSAFILQISQRIGTLIQGVRQEADLSVLAGLIALEEGDVDEAETAFRLALAWWQDSASAASGRTLDFRSRPIAQACLAWLEK